MHLLKQENNQFDDVIAHVEKMRSSNGASASAVFVIHKDKVVTEEYFGYHSDTPGAREIQADSQFHAASVRKSYIGFAVACSLFDGHISSIDDPIIDYLPDVDLDIVRGTTIRHCLTHTHGLRKGPDGSFVRHFKAGQDWEYRNPGVNLLIELVRKTTGKTVAQLLRERVFSPLDFTETGWAVNENETLVQIVYEPNSAPGSLVGTSSAGDQANLFTTARELAYWGFLHLKKGLINGEQHIPQQIFNWTTSLQSPQLADPDHPQHGFLWFVKDLPATRAEIGELVPSGSYQILGITGAAVLVIPEQQLVAVRMYNKIGNSDGYDYLRDIKDFGNIVMACLHK